MQSWWRRAGSRGVGRQERLSVSNCDQKGRLHRLPSSPESSNQQRTSELEQQIENENQRTEDISEMQEYMQSDEYLEKVAKDKLGLVKDGEIIFKESN